MLVITQRVDGAQPTPVRLNSLFAPFCSLFLAFRSLFAHLLVTFPHVWLTFRSVLTHCLLTFRSLLAQVTHGVPSAASLKRYGNTTISLIVSVGGASTT